MRINMVHVAHAQDHARYSDSDITCHALMHGQIWSFWEGGVRITHIYAVKFSFYLVVFSFSSAHVKYNNFLI